MKISDKLYNINKQISFYHIKLKKPVTYYDICAINRVIEKVIKDLKDKNE